MNSLFIGDIVGRPGRTMLQRHLDEIRAEFSIDITVVNGENAAGGLGITPEILDEILGLGVQGVTLGNHTWRKKQLAPVLNEYDAVVRPANYPQGVPGQGATVLKLADGRSLGVVNVLGRVYLEPIDCPFEAAQREVESLRSSTSHILVDCHAEATAEKVAMGWHLDGLVTAVVGTHTHVQTADERILPRGTAYITDVGMTGPSDSVIGMERDIVLHKFLTGMPSEFRVARDRPILNGVVIESGEGGEATSIRRVYVVDERGKG